MNDEEHIVYIHKLTFSCVASADSAVSLGAGAGAGVGAVLSLFGGEDLPSDSTDDDLLELLATFASS